MSSKIVPQIEEQINLEIIKQNQRQKIMNEAIRKSNMIRQRDIEKNLKPVVMKPIPEVIPEPKEPLIIQLVKFFICN